MYALPKIVATSAKNCKFEFINEGRTPVIKIVRQEVNGKFLLDIYSNVRRLMPKYPHCCNAK